MVKSDFPKKAKRKIIRRKDASHDPSVRHEDVSPAGKGQRMLLALGRPVSSPWKIPGVMTRLHQYARESLTAFQISVRLNHEFALSLSRKAVIGALKRQNISPSKLNPQLKNTPHRHSHPVVQRKTRLVVDTIPEPRPRGDVPDGCRYLHGDSAERNFCGDKVATGAWCSYHHKKVYTTNDYTRQEKNWRRPLPNYR